MPVYDLESNLLGPRDATQNAVLCGCDIATCEAYQAPIRPALIFIMVNMVLTGTGHFIRTTLQKNVSTDGFIIGGLGGLELGLLFALLMRTHYKKTNLQEASIEQKQLLTVGALLFCVAPFVGYLSDQSIRNHDVSSHDLEIGALFCVDQLLGILILSLSVGVFTPVCIGVSALCGVPFGATEVTSRSFFGKYSFFRNDEGSEDVVSISSENSHSR
ncbi:MAG: hypothetical protein P1U36_04530 [Legionellaceae bacterium]|nr:hypothetical protein [Legionellaceae bacterium]